MNRQFSKEDIQITKKHLKLLNITNYQGNANQNQNHNATPPYSCKNGYNLKIKKIDVYMDTVNRNTHFYTDERNVN